MDYFPVFLATKHKPCLIVGGGEVAYRKAKLLCDAQARIDVLSPQIIPDLSALVKLSQGLHYATTYSQHKDLKGKDLTDYILIIAASDDEQTNQQVAQDAQQKNIPVNVVDNKARCSCIIPAIVDRSPLVIAISSSGIAPVLSRLLRSKIESLIPHTYGQLAQLMKPWRMKIKALLPNVQIRRRFLESVFQGPIAELVFQHKTQAAKDLLAQALDRLAEQKIHEEVCQGEVYIVGAGPGDPDLLTFKALRLMQQADVVLYDQLVSKEIIKLARRDALFISVGKKAGCKNSTRQDQIHQMMLDYAKAGQRVLRLKGGDPFIFGRGGEEIEYLLKHQINFQIVPGITAALGCAAYANIPLTHRDHAHSVRFLAVPGKAFDEQINQEEQLVDWPSLTKPKQTLVFYMSLAHIESLTQKLMALGMAEDTPLAVIEKGTLATQKNYFTSVVQAPTALRKHPITSPTLIIIGEVARETSA